MVVVVVITGVVEDEIQCTSVKRFHPPFRRGRYITVYGRDKELLTTLKYFPQKSLRHPLRHTIPKSTRIVDSTERVGKRYPTQTRDSVTSRGKSRVSEITGVRESNRSWLK